MKLQSFKQVITAVIIALGVTVTITQLSHALDESDTDEADNPVEQPSEVPGTQFFCGQNKDGQWTTFAQVPSRGKIEVIRWVSDFGSRVGITREERCQTVSGNFQKYYDNDTLDFITTGLDRKTRQPIVCVASKSGGGCTETLFTLNLQNRQNASQALQTLFDVRFLANGGPLPESSTRVYIDINDYLKTAPVEGSSSTASPQPETPAPATN